MSIIIQLAGSGMAVTTAGKDSACNSGGAGGGVKAGVTGGVTSTI